MTEVESNTEYGLSGYMLYNLRCHMNIKNLKCEMVVLKAKQSMVCIIVYKLLEFDIKRKISSVKSTLELYE